MKTFFSFLDEAILFPNLVSSSKNFVLKQLSHIHDVDVFATHRRKFFNVFTWRYVSYFSFSMFLVQSKSFLSEVFQS